MWALIRFAMFAMLVLALGGASTWAGGDETVLFDFRQDEAAQQWRTVNDGVMGGISEGRFRITDRGTMEFFGTLSLENNGGFASVRSRSEPLGLDDDDVIVVRVRGDGRKYYLNAQVPSLRVAFSYRAAFDTEAGQWQQVAVPVKSLQATWFGRTLKGADPVDAEKVNSLGFLLADKKPGPFRLEVDWIKVRSASDGD